MVLCLAFPDNHYFPVCCLQLSVNDPISFSVSSKLWLPIVQIRLGLNPQRTAFAEMLMPEAAVNEYQFLSNWKNDVRTAGYVSTMKPVSVSKSK